MLLEKKSRDSGKGSSHECLQATPKPVLKWAGGKRQLLPNLISSLPDRFQRYVEPMVGGGALFFALQPERSMISDSNPELINLYRTIVSDLPRIIDTLRSWEPEEATFYQIRSMRFEDLSPVAAAARVLYLNRTCFNGLYRVNKYGHFNVPWGRYKNPKIIDVSSLTTARECLRETDIHLGDYIHVLTAHAKADDLVFLDPPYLPISQHSDFKRYTKDQFREADHRQMRSVVEMLRDRGCYTIITNSNHRLMYELYDGFKIEVVVA